MKIIRCDNCTEIICKGEPVFRCIHSDEYNHQILIRSSRVREDGNELNCEICMMRFGDKAGNVHQVLGDDYDELPWIEEKLPDGK